MHCETTELSSFIFLTKTEMQVSEMRKISRNGRFRCLEAQTSSQAAKTNDSCFLMFSHKTLLGGSKPGPSQVPQPTLLSSQLGTLTSLDLSLRPHSLRR